MPIVDDDLLFAPPIHVNAPIYSPEGPMAVEQFSYKLQEAGPIQWDLCPTTETIDACPQSPNFFNIVSIEPYNYFEAYRANVRWTSTVLDCSSSSNESISAFF